VGAFTEEEFDAAHGSEDARAPSGLKAFFDQEKVSPNEQGLPSLWKFQERLRHLGHYWTKYEGSDSLKLQLREQLDKLQDAWR
jgi:hypothetical protein